MGCGVLIWGEKKEKKKLVDVGWFFSFFLVFSRKIDWPQKKREEV